MRKLVCLSILLVLTTLHAQSQAVARLDTRDARERVPSDSDSVKDVLFKIEKTFEVFFNYDDDLLNQITLQEEVTIPESKADLDVFLGKLFSNYDLEYEKLTDTTYIIYRKTRKSSRSAPDKEDNPEEEQSIRETQDIKKGLGRIDRKGTTLEGKVTDENGETLPGATIIVKGTNDGTITDIHGNFKLDIAGSTFPVVLAISFVGYKSQEIAVTAESFIKVTLSADIAALDEIVVVGYGEQKRSNLTGSISSVKVKDLENKPIIRLDQALQGMSSGVFVSKGGGAPGASPTIHIRGVGSINNTDPLWIVDGIKMSPGNHFNLDDVESIEILKDAASAAIYGAEAAHGVILVTTKRGKEGQTQISYKSSFAKVNPIRLPELLGSEDFVNYKRQARLNAGQNPEPAWDNWEYDTDWIDAYYAGSGFSHYHDFSISKGTERSNYYLSLGYDDEEGILIDNSFQRFSLRFNSDFELAKWLKIGESILLSRVGENPIDNFNEDYQGSIPYRSIPIMPIYDESNPYGGWGRAPVYFQGPNPVASQYQQHEKQVNNRLDGNMYIQATPLKGLTMRARVGYNYTSFLGRAFKEAFDYGAFANPINSLTYSDGNYENITGNFVTTYEKAFGKHSFKIMGGYEASKVENVSYNVTATDLPLDIAWSFNLATGTFNTTNRQTLYESRLLSQFGRINYNFDDRYLLEANVRRDASAPIFGPKNIWGIFPSYSAAWRISEESFMQNVAVLSNLKVRASTGRLGSDNIGSFIYAKTYTSQFSTYAYDAAAQNKQSGFYISKFPNADVKWEEVNMHNIGLDVGLFDDKILLSADYYIKDTKDLLYAVPIPSSSGISTHNFDARNPEINVGTMRNSGLDLDLAYRDHFGVFNLKVNGNTSFMKNEVLRLNGDEYITSGNGGGQIGGMTRTQAGMPISSFYGYVVQQMLNSEADVYAVNSWAPDGIYQEAGTGPGDFMYKDISGPNGVPDGQITAEYDRTFIGNPWPKMMYGLNITGGYKQLIDVMLQFQGVHDVDIFNANKAYTRNFFGDNNTTTDIFEAWTAEAHTSHPRNIANDPNGNFGRPSTYFIEDGSYLKLRNAQIGINMPPQMLEKMGIGKIRVYVNANNLLTIRKYSGMDPEIAGSNVSRGVDYGLYPHTRTFGGGLEVQF